MAIRVFAVILGVLVSVAACGAKAPDADGGAGDAGTCDGGKVFGDACTTACECSSHVCFTFGTGLTSCTLTCTGNTDCPAGSQGQKCNGQGMCRP